MKFSIVMRIDDVDVVMLEWNVETNENGNLDFESSGELTVFEHKGLDRKVIEDLKNIMRVMVESYVGGDDEYSGENSEDAENED